jgi:hypothetical protein
MEKDATVKKTNNIQIKRKKMNQYFSFYLQNLLVRPTEIAKPNIEVGVSK